jgi:hypothetical protein
MYIMRFLFCTIFTFGFLSVCASTHFILIFPSSFY